MEKSSVPSPLFLFILPRREQPERKCQESQIIAAGFIAKFWVPVLIFIYSTDKFQLTYFTSSLNFIIMIVFITFPGLTVHVEDS